MKKIITIFLACMLIITYSGCNNVKQNQANSATPNNDDYSSLKVVTNSKYRSLLTYGVSTMNGFYEMLIWPLEIYNESSPWLHIGNLVYTDFQTHTKVYLCSLPGCRHNNVNCTSYMRYSHGIVLFTNSTQTKLFIAEEGATGGEVYSENDLGRIHKMDLDGRNRKEIYRLKANENFSSFVSDAVVADENHLFVCIEITVDATHFKKVLREINLITGEVRDLFELKIREYLVSAFDDILVIADYSKGESLNTFNGYSVLQNKKEEYYYGQDISSAAGNLLFFTSQDNSLGSLTIFDVKSKTEVLIVENIPKDGYVFVNNYFDNKVQWNYIENPDKDDPELEYPREYIIDCLAGELTERTLVYYTDNGVVMRMVSILEETGNSFFVIMDAVDSSIEITDREGIPHLYDWPDKPVTALIKKTDYWNNNPNYTIIVDTVALA